MAIFEEHDLLPSDKSGLVHSRELFPEVFQWIYTLQKDLLKFLRNHLHFLFFYGRQECFAYFS